MTVQQHHRFPFAAVPHAERHVADIDAVQLEAIEHEPHYPGAPARTEMPKEPAQINVMPGCRAIGGQLCSRTQRPHNSQFGTQWKRSSDGRAADHIGGSRA